VRERDRERLRLPLSCVVWVLARAHDEGLKSLAPMPVGVRLVVGDEPASFAGQPPADVLFVCSSGRDLLPAVLPMAPQARWIHSRSVGVEGLPLADIAQRGVPLTNGRGVFSRSLAEWVIAAVLYFAKDLRRLVKSQEAGKWDPFPPELVAGRWMGIVGYGDIGRTVAVQARALGMRIRALRRSAGAPSGDPAPDEMLPRERLADLMALSDDVVVATPHTPETQGLIGEREIRAMKPTGVIVNVGRGAVVQEKPLLEALRERRIRGAALDVFEKEPLPPGHPFFGLDNLLLSPHSADQVPGWLDEATQAFRENLARFREGKPLRYLVDPRLGY
jgi:phosphoglycerate dehydrogenase-like enzyme